MHDIDVLIELKGLNIMQLRQKLQELSKQFASVAGVKLYYVKASQAVGKNLEKINQSQQELKDDLIGEDLVLVSHSNVLIETLQAGSLGLPTVAQPIYKIEHEGTVIEILHPGVLVLTKMKRWYLNRDSTRPKTVAKILSDKRDLDYLVSWLVYNDMTIEFEKYQGKTKEELLKYVRAYGEISKEDEELMKDLEAAMKPEDWELLGLLTKASHSSESNPPIPLCP